MFLESLEATKISLAIKQSVWLFPFIEIAHLLALALLMGTSFFFTRGVLEKNGSSQTFSHLERATRPWLLFSLLLLLSSGTLLFLSEPVRLAQNNAFLLKMVFLFFYLWAVFFSRAKFARKKGSLAIISTLLLLLTAAAGRWIGFY